MSILALPILGLAVALAALAVVLGIKVIRDRRPRLVRGQLSLEQVIAQQEVEFIAAFADAIGQPLLPWQKDFLVQLRVSQQRRTVTGGAW